MLDSKKAKKLDWLSLTGKKCKILHLTGTNQSLALVRPSNRTWSCLANGEETSDCSRVPNHDPDAADFAKDDLCQNITLLQFAAFCASIFTQSWLYLHVVWPVCLVGHKVSLFTSPKKENRSTSCRKTIVAVFETCLTKIVKPYLSFIVFGNKFID